jgi:uncharacterized protein YqjF (DUF2071 family)
MTTKEILRYTSHRNVPIPNGPWLIFQSWREVVFLHWQLPAAILEPYVPRHRSLQLDYFDNTCWISLICFRVAHARIRGLPPLPGTSSFFEINLRMYVTCNNSPGVVFLDIHSDNSLINLLNRMIHLPYSKGNISSKEKNQYRYTDPGAADKNIVELNFSRLPAQPLSQLDKWLTERYYAFQPAGKSVWQFPIHHAQWPLQAISLTDATVSYKWQDIALYGKELHTAHYSKGVDVVFWHPRKLYTISRK